jgi:adenylate cyclase
MRAVQKMRHRSGALPAFQRGLFTSKVSGRPPSHSRKIVASATRRLAALLFADIAAYTRLMQADEAGIYAAWKRARAEAVEPTVARHGGRVVKFTGDGFLAEFPAAEAALASAIELQGGFAPYAPLKLRIGVHLGDVYSEGGDLYGDDVNIAARLESLAEAGGICLSGTVHDLVHRKIAAKFEDGGRQPLKNVEQPLQVWRIAAATLSDEAPAAAAPSGAPVDQAATGRRASIAVLPFVNMSGDPEQAYFADGLSEDIITELSRTGALFVIARNSTFAYKGRAVNVGEIARDLKVRFVLEGSVRKAGQRVRVTAQLIDASTGGHVWAERYDRDITDIFAVQDELTRSIVAALALNLSPEFDRRVGALGTSNIEAYDLFLKGRELAWKMSKPANAEALELLERAIAIDPGFTRAYAVLAHVYVLQHMNGWSADAAADERRAGDLAETAMRLNPFDPYGYWMMAAVHLTRRDFERTLAMAERALSLDSSVAGAYSGLGAALLGLDRPQEAFAPIEAIERVDPHAPSIVLHYRARALFMVDRLDEAIEVLRQRIARSPDTDTSRALLASILGHLGRRDEALAVWAELQRINPGYVPDRRRSIASDREFEKLCDGLRKAGVQP